MVCQILSNLLKHVLDTCGGKCIHYTIWKTSWYEVLELQWLFLIVKIELFVFYVYALQILQYLYRTLEHLDTEETFNSYLCLTPALAPSRTPPNGLNAYLLAFKEWLRILCSASYYPVHCLKVFSNSHCTTETNSETIHNTSFSNKIVFFFL